MHIPYTYIHKDCVKAGQKGLSSGSSLTIHVNIWESYWSTYHRELKRENINKEETDCGGEQTWQHLQLLHNSSPVNPSLVFVIVSKHTHRNIYKYVLIWIVIRVCTLAIRQCQRECQCLGAGGRRKDGWKDGRMDGWSEDRMTGWQNRVKDTLQYYVTARQTHQGVCELRRR